MLRALQAPESDKLHQRAIRPAVLVCKPQGRDGQGRHEDRALEGAPQRELACERELEEHEPGDDAVAHHDPALAGRVLAVLHGVEELVLVHEVANGEVDEAAEKDLPRVAEDAVDEADDEDEDGLGEEEAVAEYWGLDKFGVV